MSPGDLVICIDELAPTSHGEHLPTKGAVYTVRDDYIDPCGAHGIRLEEIVNQRRRYTSGMCECAFNIKAFRPLTDTRLAVFREMLTRIPTTEERIEAVQDGFEFVMEKMTREGA